MNCYAYSVAKWIKMCQLILYTWKRSWLTVFSKHVEFTVIPLYRGNRIHGHNFLIWFTFTYIEAVVENSDDKNKIGIQRHL